MTREEAVEMLKKDKQQRGECFISEALNMAIEALEQKPCEDAISRKAVLNASICDGILCKKCSFYNRDYNREDGQIGCLLYERINNLPSVRQHH